MVEVELQADEGVVDQLIRGSISAGELQGSERPECFEI